MFIRDNEYIKRKTLNSKILSKLSMVNLKNEKNPNIKKDNKRDSVVGEIKH